MIKIEKKKVRDIDKEKHTCGGSCWRRNSFRKDVKPNAVSDSWVNLRADLRRRLNEYWHWRTEPELRKCPGWLMTKSLQLALVPLIVPPLPLDCTLSPSSPPSPRPLSCYHFCQILSKVEGLEWRSEIDSFLLHRKHSAVCSQKASFKRRVEKRGTAKGTKRLFFQLSGSGD